jgi:hypothetical protein
MPSPLGRLSCDSPVRSSMILGNPTETTMGSDDYAPTAEVARSAHAHRIAWCSNINAPDRQRQHSLRAQSLAACRRPPAGRILARITPIRANIVGPFRSATRISASIAACHSGASCSALRSLVM